MLISDEALLREIDRYITNEDYGRGQAHDSDYYDVMCDEIYERKIDDE